MPATTRRLPRPILLLGGLLSAGIVLLVAAELFARTQVPAHDDFYVWPPRTERVFRPRSDIMPGISGTSVFRINSIGLRGDEPPADDAYRILTVGGSTTECLYLDQGEAWPQLVQELLVEATGTAAWVGNAGRSGHTTREHVLQVEHLVEQDPAPDLLILMAGVNDLGKRLSRGDDYDPGAMRSPEFRKSLRRAAFSVVPNGPESHLPPHKQTALFRWLRDLKDSVLPDPRTQQETGEVYLDWRRRRSEPAAVLDELPDLGPALQEFDENLSLCVRAATARGVRVLLLDQPYLWRADLEPELVALLWMGGIGEYYRLDRPTYYSPRALAEGMARYNAVVRRVAEREGVEFLGVDAAVPRTGAMYYDDVHYTEAGSLRVAERVTEYLLSRAPFAP